MDQDFRIPEPSRDAIPGVTVISKVTFGTVYVATSGPLIGEIIDAKTPLSKVIDIQKRPEKLGPVVCDPEKI